jgi:hypothetical protein
MPPKPPTQQMGEKHEEYLAGVNAGRKTVASGSKWTDPGDGRNAHDLPYAFAWDGKSTHGKSITVTLDMIAKIREQALGELPQIGLRWYATEDLRNVHEDWVAVPGDSWQDILASARAWVELETSLDGATRDDLAGVIKMAGTAGELQSALAEAHRALMDAGEQIAVKNLELEALRASQSAPRELAQWVPRLPWTVIHAYLSGSAVLLAAIRYTADGSQVTTRPSFVRVERTPDNRPRLMADDVIVRNGDLYQEGKLTVRACEDDPSIEVG